MPTLRQITCSVIWGDIDLKEYRHRFTDGAVETYIAVPGTDEPFSLVVQSEGYIAPGLAAYVYIDGEYQANRNKVGLPFPHHATVSELCDVKFTFRQKEDKLPTGKFIGRNWSFAKLRKTAESSKASAESNPDFRDNVGTIEVIVLRCAAFNDVQESPALSLHDSEQVRVRKLESNIESRTSKASKPQSNASFRSAKEREPEAQNEFGGLFGLFDGASDEHTYGEYLPRAHRTLPMRYETDWRTASRRQPGYHPQDRRADMGHRRTRSPGEWIRLPRCSHSRDHGIMSNADDSHVHRHQNTQESLEYYSSASRDTGHHDPRPTEPTSDELERLVMLHEQLKQSNAEAQEIIKSKELFERTAKGATSQRMQNLSAQKLQELEQQLQSTNVKRAKDTDFIFECLAEMDRVQLAFARSALRGRDIVLPSLEQVQRWLRHKNKQVRVSIRSEVEKDDQPNDEQPQFDDQQVDDQQQNDDQKGDDGWQEVGEGVINTDHSQASPKSGQEEGHRSQIWQNDYQEQASNHSADRTPWENADVGNDNNAPGDDDAKEQTNAWDNSGQSDKQSGHWNNDDNRSKTKTKLSSSKSTSTKVASQQHQDRTWRSSSDRASKKDDRDVKPRSGISSKTSTLRSSDSVDFREPKRVIKPYWASRGAGRHDNDTRGKDGSRDVYEFPAEPAPALPRDKPKGVSHGVQIGKGTTYVHKHVQPKYMDTLQNPYAVFVFHYRSKEELEKLLGRSIDNQFHKMTKDLDWEDLMQLSKEDLVQKLMEPGRSEKNREKPHHSNSNISNDEVTPDDSVSQVVTSAKQSVTSKEQKREKTRYHKREHDSSHKRKEVHKAKKSREKVSSQGGASANRWDVKTSNDWNNRDSKSKAPSSATHEHFAGEEMQTTKDTSNVAW